MVYLAVTLTTDGRLRSFAIGAEPAEVRSEKGSIPFEIRVYRYILLTGEPGQSQTSRMAEFVYEILKRGQQLGLVVR